MLVVGTRKFSIRRCFLSEILTTPETLNLFLFLLIEERVRFVLFFLLGVAELECPDLPKVFTGVSILGVVVVKGNAAGSGLELAAIGLSLYGVGCSEHGRMVGGVPA